MVDDGVSVLLTRKEAMASLKVGRTIFNKLVADDNDGLARWRVHLARRRRFGGLVNLRLRIKRIVRTAR